MKKMNSIERSFLFWTFYIVNMKNWPIYRREKVNECDPIRRIQLKKGGSGEWIA